MFESIINFFKKFSKEEKKDSKDTAKERLHLVLMQDRANVSADFLEMMKQEIIEVIKKYIDVDENSIDVKLTNKVNSDGTTGAPALYANIPIVSLKDDTKKLNINREKADEVAKKEEKEKAEEIEENLDKKEESEVKKEEHLQEKNKKEEEQVVEEKAELTDENEEVTDVICEFCGRNMVIKQGRYGKGYYGIYANKKKRY